jgi:hypothetical protein
MSLLSERCMLAKARVGTWSGTLYDPNVTEEVREHHAAEQGAGRYNKQIVARKFLHPVTSKVSAATRAHRVLTLPWADDGPRILSNQAYNIWAQQMRLARQDIQATAKDVASKRGEMMAEARQRLKGMFNDDEYPSAEEIEQKFYLDTEIMPMPEAQDFRAQLSDEAVKGIVKDIERRSKEHLEAAVADIYTRVGTCVGRMVERLKGYEPATDEEGAKYNFKDSLIYNIKEVADLIPMLNVTADPKLDALGKQLVDDLVQHSPEELKANPKLRAQTAKKADAIYAKVKKYMA